MKRIVLALELFFQRQVGDDEHDLSAAWEQMSRDIKGCIYTLFALFELVALTSHVPIDTINVFQGRLDHINNLGGIVGAIFSEWLIGSVGVMGYTIIFITVYLAYSAFQGNPLRDNVFKIIGSILTILLAAITCRLLFITSFPELSIFQGGLVGRVMGDWLLHYFNTTGALLIVGGAFVVTGILTTGVSIIRTLKSVFNEEESNIENEAYEEEEEELEEKPKKKVKKKKPAKKKAKPKKSKSKSKAKKKADEDEEEEELDEEELEELEEEFDEEEEEEMEEEEEEEDEGVPELIPAREKYTLPSPRLLKSHAGGAKKPSKRELREDTNKLCDHLFSFNITGKVTNISIGPVLSTYEFKPSAGIKLKSIAGVQDDLGIVLGTPELRIVAPIPGKTTVGIEVPRPSSEVISLKEMVSHNDFYSKKIKLPVALGKSTEGQPIIGDLAAMPHLLVAGATGSGKSVFVNSMIAGFLYRMSPQQLRLILVDPKMLELNAFEGLPHLVSNVITKNQFAFNALNWAVEEMERRYEKMARSGSKNIDSYNSKATGSQKLPYIVVIVDELADLMMTGGDEVEVAITRLAQKARAAGIHLVLATQRPSTDVVTGLIKANIPSRISFKVPSAIDSRTVLDTSGAQDLMGRGDSLMIRPGVPLQRIHGCFVGEDELKRLVNNVKGRKDHDHLYIDFSKKIKKDD